MQKQSNNSIINIYLSMSYDSYEKYILTAIPSELDELIAKIQNSHVKQETSIPAFKDLLRLESSAQNRFQLKNYDDLAYLRLPEPQTCLLTKKDDQHAHQYNFRDSSSDSAQDVKVRWGSATVKNPVDVDESCGSDDEESQKEQGRGNIMAAKKERKDRKAKKVKKGKKEAYPTNNFLPKFRTIILKHLKQFFEKGYFQSIQVVKDIQKKGWVTLKQFQNLLNHSEFQPILKVYLTNKVIKRDLMLSGGQMKTKLEYLKRIDVIEQAFRTGKFEKINE